MLENLLFNESFKKGFTLAEGATHVDISHNSSNFGFTLAEVLITLGIIGVVAAITMPMLITNVRNHVRAKRIENIEQKFSKATDKMVALGVYNGHGSTAEFVNELGKHLKLAKVCDNSNLASCWPYSEVELSDGKMWKIADTKKAKNMKMDDSETATWDDTMGIITADGTSMLISYNTKCDIDETKKIEWNGSVSSTTGCVAVKYDWNGATKPNKDNDDVLAINAGAFGNSCLFEVGGTCYSKVIKTVEPINGNYYQGAISACGGKERLPDLSNLAKLAESLYVKSGTMEKVAIGKQDNVYSLTFQADSEIAKVLDLTPPFYLWSSESVSSDNAYGRNFYSDSSTSVDKNFRPASKYQAICIGD